jgi:environmental stress-induced protein Ves
MHEKRKKIPNKLFHLCRSDYTFQTWKNGLGRTEEIAIYPPEKDFTKDDFFWRFSINRMHADCNFSVFPGYDW